jgi:hypothetical protein
MGDMEPTASKLLLDPIGSLFGKSWARYKGHFWTLVQICLLPAFVIAVGDLLMSRQAESAVILGSIINIIGIAVTIMATVALITAIAHGMDFGHAYDRGVKLFWPAVLIAALNLFVLFGGFLIFIIPGILFIVWVAFANYALVLDGKHGLDALLTSKEYVKGYWWETFGRGLLLFVLFFVVMLVLYLPSLYFFGEVVGGAVYAILLLLFVPFSFCYSFEFYDNLRRLKPELAGQPVKEGKRLFIVFMILGIITIATLSVFAAIAPNNAGDNRAPMIPAYPPTSPITPPQTST